MNLLATKIITFKDRDKMSNSPLLSLWGWSGGAMVLGKLSVPGRPTIWIIVEQGPIALAVGAGGGCLDIFTLLYPSSPLSPSLWETVRYRLKYCLKGPLETGQPTKPPLSLSLSLSLEAIPPPLFSLSLSLSLSVWKQFPLPYFFSFSGSKNF